MGRRPILNVCLLLLAGALVVLDWRSRSAARGVTVTVAGGDAVPTVYRTDAARFESSFGSFKWRLVSRAFDHVPRPGDKSWVGGRRYKVDARVVGFGEELIEAAARGEGSMKATFRCRSVPCVVVRYRPALVLLAVVAAAANWRVLARWWRLAVTRGGTSPGSSPPPPAAAPSPPPPRR